MPRSILGLILVGVGLVTACGGDGSTGQNGGNAAGDSGSVDGASGGADGSVHSDGGPADAATIDSGGDTGAADGGSTDGGGADAGLDGGGDGGMMMPRSGTATVAGAVKASSTSYRIVTTTGQSPGGNGSMSSPSYRLKGGVVGATQGK